MVVLVMGAPVQFAASWTFQPTDVKYLPAAAASPFRVVALRTRTTIFCESAREAVAPGVGLADGELADGEGDFEGEADFDGVGDGVGDELGEGWVALGVGDVRPVGLPDDAVTAELPCLSCKVPQAIASAATATTISTTGSTRLAPPGLARTGRDARWAALVSVRVGVSGPAADMASPFASSGVTRSLMSSASLRLGPARVLGLHAQSAR